MQSLGSCSRFLPHFTVFKTFGEEISATQKNGLAFAWSPISILKLVIELTTRLHDINRLIIARNRRGLTCKEILPQVHLLPCQFEKVKTVLDQSPIHKAASAPATLSASPPVREVVSYPTTPSLSQPNQKAAYAPGTPSTSRPVYKVASTPDAPLAS
ncbi:hypothetical protein ACLOJK_029809 [Asimina triloba]